MSASSQPCDSFWGNRDAAIRRFYGPLNEKDAAKTLAHLWYNLEKNYCTAQEPDDDNFAAISLATQRTALFGPKDPF